MKNLILVESNCLWYTLYMWHSLFGFKGFVELGDSSAHKRKTMTHFGSFIGVLIILMFGSVWYVQQLIRRSEPEYPAAVKICE